jgi:hypothetical protein
LIHLIEPTSWSWGVPEQTVEIDFDVPVIRNELNANVPPSFHVAISVTGTAVRADLDGDSHYDVIGRLPLAH